MRPLPQVQSVGERRSRRPLWRRQITLLQVMLRIAMLAALLGFLREYPELMIWVVLFLGISVVLLGVPAVFHALGVFLGVKIRIPDRSVEEEEHADRGSRSGR